MKLAPIVLFTYNRPKHTRLTIEALQKNELAGQSEIFIFSDGPRKKEDEEPVSAVRAFLKTIGTFRKVTIIERARNYGLANNIIAGATDIINQYKRIIVLEDDLLTSRFFLKYMNDALELYESEEKVLSIHGYIYPVKKIVPSTFFLIDPGSLGWGTWKNRWDNYEKDGSKLLAELEKKGLTTLMDYDNSFPFTKMLKHQVEGKNNSWIIRWYAYALLHKKLTLYPGKSLVFHLGNDGSGTHEGASSYLDVEISDNPVTVDTIELEVNTQAREAFKTFFKSINGNLLRRGIIKLKKIIKNGGF